MDRLVSSKIHNGDRFSLLYDTLYEVYIIRNEELDWEYDTEYSNIEEAIQDYFMQHGQLYNEEFGINEEE